MTSTPDASPAPGPDASASGAPSPLAQLSLGGQQADSRPLCVNLDGTLVVTDTLWESVLLLIRKRPWLLLMVPLWMLSGRAGLRRAVGKRVALDPAVLPYRADFVEALRASADGGRRIVLSTGADQQLAASVAEHLALFKDVVIDGDSQAGGKRDALEKRFGADGFDYVGDSAADLAVIAAAHKGYLVGASPAAASRARAMGDKVQVLSKRPSRVRALIKALRPHQWAKNALVAMPVLLAPGLPSWRHIVQAGVAMLSFSFCASAGYVFNDLMDVEADRAHKTKRRRPFASGALPVVYGPPLFVALFGVSFGLAIWFLPAGFVAMLAIYFVATLAYSFQLKSKMMLDVVVLAWLYTHRVLAGGIATGNTVSAWLLAFSMFIFASLAFAKRYIELRQSMSKGGKIKSRGYHTDDLEMVASMGPTAGYLAVLVFCLYIESNAVKIAYRMPVLLWFACPVLLYWISRVWFLAHRGQMQDDPVKFALTDRVSWACAGLLGLVAVTARFGF